MRATSKFERHRSAHMRAQSALIINNFINDEFMGWGSARASRAGERALAFANL